MFFMSKLKETYSHKGLHTIAYPLAAEQIDIQPILQALAWLRSSSLTKAFVCTKPWLTVV